MSDSYDDWDWDENERIEDYLEDRVEEYLERLETDPYDAYYNRSSPIVNKGNDEYKAQIAICAIFVQSLN